MDTTAAKQKVTYGNAYGNYAYWTTLTGLVIALTGMILHFAGISRVFNTKILINELWKGASAQQIWQAAADKQIIYGHWYLEHLSYSDSIAMAGIAIIGSAAIIGIWSAFVNMLFKKEKVIFTIFSFIIGIILILSAIGVFSFK
jgi:hypothetical protein